ncbi:hypothetical protein Hanom_Chr10g00924051 [Helianthus anomalus]
MFVSDCNGYPLTLIITVTIKSFNHWVSAQWPPARILTRRWRVRVLLVPNAPTVADLPPDSGLLGGGLRGGITLAVERTVEYPPSQSFIWKTHYTLRPLTIIRLKL